MGLVYPTRSASFGEENSSRNEERVHVKMKRKLDGKIKFERLPWNPVLPSGGLQNGDGASKERG